MVINGNISETPHFFQVIMPPALQLGKIEVPINFVRKYGGMSIAGRESVCLVVPNGDTWTVGVENSSDKVMLGEGWKEFMEHYCLGEGSFVFFRFEPDESLFAVLIFDDSWIEIKYPPKRPVAAATATAYTRRVKIKKEINRSESESNSSDQETDDDETDEDDEYEDEDDFLPTVAAATAHPHHVKVKQETNRSESESSDQETDEDNEYEDEDENDEDENDDFLTETAECTEARVHLQNLRTKSSPFKKLRTHFKGKSGNPTFRMRIQPSYLKPKSRVTLPHGFVLKNKLNKKLKVKLRLLGYGKIWQLGIFYRDNEKRGELSNAGWHRFCREVGIRVGDRCEFELTSRVGNKVFFTMSIIA